MPPREKPPARRRRTRIRRSVLRRAWRLWPLFILVAWVAPPVSRPGATGGPPRMIRPATDTAHSQFLEAEEQYRQVQYGRSIANFRKAGAIYGREKNWTCVVRCLNGLGENYIGMMEYDKAQAVFDSALETARERLNAGHPETAASLLGMGRIRFELDDFDQALEYYRNALTLAGGRALLLAKAHQRIGEVFIAKTHYTPAMEHFNASLAILRNRFGEIHPEIASVYLQMGNVYKSQHDWDQTLLVVNQALNINRHFFGESHPEIGRAYEILGCMSLFKGDCEIALHYQKLALTTYLRTMSEDHPSVAGVYYQMSNIYWTLGKFDSSLHYARKCLALCAKNPERNPLRMAQAYYRIGHVMGQTGKLDEALYYFRKSLSIRLQRLDPHSTWVAETYKSIGYINGRKGNFYKALEYYQKSITSTDFNFNGDDIYTNPTVDDSWTDFSLLPLMALKAGIFEKLYHQKGRSKRDMEAALTTYEVATQLMDHLRCAYPSEEFRLNLGSDYKYIYGRGIEAALELYRVTGDERFKEKAFLFSEKSKASALLQSLLDDRAMRFSGIPGALLEKEKTLQIDSKDCEKDIWDEQEKGAEGDSRRLGQLQNRRFALKREFDALMVRFEKEYPEYYSLKYRKHSISVKELREKLLRPDDALVEYFIGECFVYAFTVTPSRFEVTRIPNDASLEKRVKGVREGLVSMDYDRYTEDAFWVYRTLIRPVEPWIRRRNLILIPDGILGSIPFEILLTRKADGPKKDYRRLAYMIGDYLITYHYSSMIFLENGSGMTKTDPGRFLGFAPVEY
jgi:tetratricopeptide (TPR) repeat protein